jgi:hypothetical protein
LSEEDRLALLQGLEARASVVKDVQATGTLLESFSFLRFGYFSGSVVEDIIDPNLFPRKIENASWKRRTYQELLGTFFLLFAVFADV